jgi:hypothetical protein
MQLATLNLDLTSIKDLTKIDFADAPLNFKAEFKAAKRAQGKTIETKVNQLKPMTWKEFNAVATGVN